MDVWEEIKRHRAVIWGSKFVGQDLLMRCKEHDVEVLAFCDNAKEKQELCINGVPVLSPQEIRKRFPENVVLLITTQDIVSICEQMEVENIEYPYYLINQLYVLEEMPQEWSFMERQKVEAAWYSAYYFTHPEILSLRMVDFVITERCSLRCKECSNLMQFYERPTDHPLAELHHDLKNLLAIYDEIYELRIIGGEPFMHPEIEAVIKMIDAEPRIRCASFYTNATILPKASVLDAIQKSGKMWFSVSDYGALSMNIEPLLKALDARRIGYDRKPVGYWTHCASFVKQNRTATENHRIFYECCAKYTTTYQDGRLYPCPFIGNATKLHAIPDFPQDYVDLRRMPPQEARENIRRRLLDRQSYAACDWCLGRPDVVFVQESDKILPHEQVDRPFAYRRCV